MKLVQLLLGVMVCLSLFVAGCTASEKESVIVTVPTDEQKAVVKEVQSPTPVQTEPISKLVIKSETGPTEVIELPSEEAVKTFSLVAQQWEFEPRTITVSKGDKVHLTITSKDVTHGFTIKEYGIAEKIIPGKTTKVEFVADKAGTFSFFCSVPCGKGHTGMNGQLIVME